MSSIKCIWIVSNVPEFKIIILHVITFGKFQGHCSQSDSSNSDHESEEIGCDNGNYDITEYYDEQLDQSDYDDGWQQGYEEESWWSLDSKFTSGKSKQQ